MTWDIAAMERLRNRSARRVIRISKDNSVRTYKSMSHAKLFNKISHYWLTKSIEEGTELNGYYYDYA